MNRQEFPSGEVNNTPAEVAPCDWWRAPGEPPVCSLAPTWALSSSIGESRAFCDEHMCAAFPALKNVEGVRIERFSQTSRKYGGGPPVPDYGLAVSLMNLAEERGRPLTMKAALRLVAFEAVVGDPRRLYDVLRPRIEEIAREFGINVENFYRES